VPSTRRRLLATVASATAGLTGCLGAPADGESGSATPTPSPTRTPTTRSTPTTTTAALGEAVTVSGLTVTVADLASAHSLRYLTAPDAFGVASAGDGQFVIVDVTVDGDGSPPAADDFALVATEARHEPGVPDVGPSRVASPVSGRRYGDSNRRGFLFFRVPAPLDTEDLAVVLDAPDAGGARWTIPPATAEPLRSPPPAFVASVDVPSSVPADESVPVRLDVANEGAGPGVFRGAINHQGPLYGASPIDLSLSAGESTTHETLVDYYLRQDHAPDRVRFTVIGPDLSSSAEVRLKGGGTPTGARTGTATGTAIR
jgi:hypothetical protein